MANGSVNDRGDFMGEGRRRPGVHARARGTVRLATPVAVAALTVLVNALTTTLDAFKLPLFVRLARVAGGAGLAGLSALVSQRGVRHFTGGEPASAGGSVAPAQLPPVIAHFTGRADYLTRLHRVFTEDKKAREWSGCGVVSVHGPGGVGKSALVTRFAHEVAGSYPDGQLYCDLRGTGDMRIRAEDVLTGFLLALGVRLTTDPGGLADLQKLWWTWLKGRRVLLFLDNAQLAEQVQAIVPPEGGCAVLVTSRQPLYLRNTLDLRLGELLQPHVESVAQVERLTRGDQHGAAGLGRHDRLDLLGELGVVEEDQDAAALQPGPPQFLQVRQATRVGGEPHAEGEQEPGEHVLGPYAHVTGAAQVAVELPVGVASGHLVGEPGDQRRLSDASGAVHGDDDASAPFPRLFVFGEHSMKSGQIIGPAGEMRDDRRQLRGRDGTARGRRLATGEMTDAPLGHQRDQPGQNRPARDERQPYEERQLERVQRRGQRVDQHRQRGDGDGRGQPDGPASAGVHARPAAAFPHEVASVIHTAIRHFSTFGIVPM